MLFPVVVAYVTRVCWPVNTSGWRFSLQSSAWIYKDEWFQRNASILLKLVIIVYVLVQLFGSFICWRHLIPSVLLAVVVSIAVLFLFNILIQSGKRWTKNWTFRICHGHRGQVYANSSWCRRKVELFSVLRERYLIHVKDWSIWHHTRTPRSYAGHRTPMSTEGSISM